MRQKQVHFVLLAAAAVLVVPSGCSQHSAVKNIKTVPVTGTVYLNGKPITRGSGSVQFHTSRKFDGRRVSLTGRINSRGRYEMSTSPAEKQGYTEFFASKPGVPPGTYQVTVRVTEEFDRARHGPRRQPAWLIPSRYGSRIDSPLQVTVKINGEGDYDLHLKR